jgi:hypothetical protein
VRFPWQRQDYARTCSEYGYTWRVPRSATRRRFRPVSAFLTTLNGRTLDRGELARQVQSLSVEKQAIEVFQHCPECGADQFTQHAVRSEPPA